MLVGVMADTHGLLRPQALAALEGVALILHAGDVGSPDILPALRHIAPVRAIRGNVDRGPYAQALPMTDVIEVGGQMVYILHDVKALDLNPAAAGFAAVISGHSHQPSIQWKNGVLFLNPGSVGPRRFRLPVTLAHLRLSESRLQVEIITL